MNVYKPLDWQVAPWRDKAPTMLLTGAAGGGKSRLLLEKVHGFMLKYPGATGIVGRKDRTSAGKSVVPFLLHAVMGDTDWGHFLKTDGLFEYKNGSQLWVVGLDGTEQRESLKSIGKDGFVDYAAFDEANALTEEDANVIFSRMRGKSASWTQVAFSTNPDAPTHWINRDLILGGNASVYYSRPEDNTYNPPEYIDRLKKLTGVYYQRLYLGLWVQAEGAIYPEYDSGVHLVERGKVKVDPNGRWIVSTDFGFTNPFSSSLWYIDNDDKMYRWKQVYRTGRTVEDHAPFVKAMVGDLPIEAWITDHDAEDRATMERHVGITTLPAYKAVMPGIQAMKQRLAEKRIFFVRDAVDDPDPDLLSARKPTCTEEEIAGYRWSSKKQDTPVKEADHGLDETRYAVAYVDDLQGSVAEVVRNPFYDG